MAIMVLLLDMKNIEVNNKPYEIFFLLMVIINLKILKNILLNVYF